MNQIPPLTNLQARDVDTNGQSLDRAPREGAIELTVPPPDFERIMWQA